VLEQRRGAALVPLGASAPLFVRAHRASFAYQLTPVASARSATVTEEVVDDRFTISTGKPHVKVTWRVTATRKQQGKR
jgi:hypothetical protein